METDQSMLLATPISFASKRKLIHVISPYVEVARTENNAEAPSRHLETSINARTRSGRQSEDCPMSTEQMTVLLSIQRSREAFVQYTAGGKGKYNMTDRKAPKATEKGSYSNTTAHFTFDEIELVCAILTKDMSQLQSFLQTICDRIVALSRSTNTTYGTNRSLPFLQDILDASQLAHMTGNVTGGQIQLASEKDDNFYLFSNADIGLSQNFYVHLNTRVRELQASALSINRMTLDIGAKGKKEATSTENSDLKTSKASFDRANLTTDAWDSASQNLKKADDLIANNQFRRHPGYDCFLFHSSVLRRIHFGDFFVGFPPFGANVHLALRIMAPNYVNLASNPNGTFHIGNDRDWHTSDAKTTVTDPTVNKSNQSKQQSITESSYEFWTKFQEDLHYLPWCPISNHPPPNEYAMQNSINCGKWFHPSRQWSKNPKTSSWLWPTPYWQHTKSAIPTFVRKGSEAIYLQNYAKYLNYTQEGMPLVAGQQTPEIKRRWPKIVRSRRNKLLQTITSFSK